MMDTLYLDAASPMVSAPLTHSKDKRLVLLCCKNFNPYCIKHNLTLSPKILKYIDRVTIIYNIWPFMTEIAFNVFFPLLFIACLTHWRKLFLNLLEIQIKMITFLCKHAKSHTSHLQMWFSLFSMYIIGKKEP